MKSRATLFRGLAKARLALEHAQGNAEASAYLDGACQGWHIAITIRKQAANKQAGLLQRAIKEATFYYDVPFDNLAQQEWLGILHVLERVSN